MSLFFARRRREPNLDGDIRSHLRMAVEEGVARSESQREAELAVRSEFGNEARVREVTRMMWRGMWLNRLGQDVRFALLTLPPRQTDSTVRGDRADRAPTGAQRRT